ncbi:MAG: DUF2299 domain-containing protein [Desulfurococcales archaeon]|nr:DUF2299 domain-containing protein [Desulfurococcales archaeon]
MKGESDLREKIVNMFLDEGFEVKKLPVTPQVKLNWGLEVITPPPIRVKLHVISIPGKEDRLIVTLPVTISPQHMVEYSKLAPRDKIELYASITQKLIFTCPTCTIVLQNNPLDLRNIAVSKVLMIEDLDAKSIVENFSLMVNLFNIIISEINRMLPGPMLSQIKDQSRDESTTHL